MRGIAQAAFGLIAAAALASAASDVHDLKADSFASFVTKHDIVLAEFFAPWYGAQQSESMVLAKYLLLGAATAKLSPPSTRRLRRR